MIVICFLNFHQMLIFSTFSIQPKNITSTSKPTSIKLKCNLKKYMDDFNNNTNLKEEMKLVLYNDVLIMRYDKKMINI